MARPAPLRLSGIRIKNVRCFDDVYFDLDNGRRARSWAVIFGDNGVGKTTLLRCIAMGLCDEASAAGLLREIYGEWHRIEGRKAKTSEIELTFKMPRGEARILTKVIPQKSGYSKVTQEATTLRGSDFPWNRIFACGYGAARRSFGTKDIAEYATIDSVYTLFNYDTPLQNPELVLRRLSSTLASSSRKKPNGHENGASLLESLSAVLMLPPGSIKLTDAGLVIKGPWGEFQPIGGLGDGFQATLSWVTDFLGWAMLYDPGRDLKDVKGIVLIDEIEQHLHPRWQRRIIKLLYDQFPGVQFIATTHTPMCAIGTTDIDDDDCELVKLDRKQGAVLVSDDLKPPRRKRADQILTSELFGLATAGDNETLGKITRLNRLLMATEPSAAIRNEASRLRAELRSEFLQNESAFETRIRQEVRRALAADRDRQIDLEAADFEVIRVLRELEAHEED